jgi:hypothetical protein
LKQKIKFDKKNDKILFFIPHTKKFCGKTRKQHESAFFAKKGRKNSKKEFFLIHFLRLLFFAGLDEAIMCVCSAFSHVFECTTRKSLQNIRRKFLPSKIGFVFTMRHIQD